MRKLFVGLGALVIPAVFAGFAVTGCDEANSLAGDVCGPCGSLATGDVSIAGDARLDGFFTAVADLGKATGKINANFEADLADLEAIFEVDVAAGASLDARVDALIAKIEGTLTASVEGGIRVSYVPPKCSASLNVAVEAQASCEAKAECEVEANPGSVSVTCEGSCTGSCEGGCSADATAVCEVKGPSVACTGKCEGTCTVDVSGACDGKCEGTCSGSTDSGGKCDGQCEGKCSVTGNAECSGSCSGSCTAEAPEGGCEASATAKCEGKCEGSCSGGCTGEATPPSASASCEASADCQASASAQASANLECTPPSLSLDYQLSAALQGDAEANIEARAKFTAQIEALKVKGAAILKGFEQYKLLVEGDASIGFESPVAKIQGQLEGFVDMAVSGDFSFDIPKARLLCLPAAFEEAISVVGKVATEGSANIAAQGKLAAKLTGGFSS